jgi:hypothetical protein
VAQEADVLVITAKQATRPKVNYPVRITATAHGQTFEAELLNEVL